MSIMLLPGLRHVLRRWLNLLARVIGRHGKHFGKGLVIAVNLSVV